MIASEQFAQYAQYAMQGMQLLFLKFSRDDERQADQLGWNIPQKWTMTLRRWPISSGCLKK